MSAGHRALVSGVAASAVLLTACTPGQHAPASRSTVTSQPPAIGELLGTALHVTTAPAPLTTPLPTRHRSGREICEDAHLGQIASASETTVLAVRSMTGQPGPAHHPVLLWPHALAPAPGTAQAAWCWVATGQNTWTDYLASEGIVPELIGTESGPAAPPIGPYPLR